MRFRNPDRYEGSGTCNNSLRKQKFAQFGANLCSPPGSDISQLLSLVLYGSHDGSILMTQHDAHQLSRKIKILFPIRVDEIAVLGVNHVQRRPTFLPPPCPVGV